MNYRFLTIALTVALAACGDNTQSEPTAEIAATQSYADELRLALENCNTRHCDHRP